MGFQLDVNYIAVTAAAIAAFVIGFLWYSPKFFGNEWIRLNGWSKKDMQKNQKRDMKKPIALGFITAWVIAFVLAEIIALLDLGLGMSGAEAGVKAALMVWIGFFATSMMGSVLWEMKPWKLYFINSGHYLVVLIVMSLIITAM